MYVLLERLTKTEIITDTLIKYLETKYDVLKKYMKYSTRKCLDETI